MNHKTYTDKQFSKIFDNAYAVVIDGSIYDIFNDYETFDGELITALVLNGDMNNDVIELPHDIEHGGVEYNEDTNKFHFLKDEDYSIGWFRVLVVATLD